MISAVLKFSPQQTQVALEKEHQRRSLVSAMLILNLLKTMYVSFYGISDKQNSIARIGASLRSYMVVALTLVCHSKIYWTINISKTTKCSQNTGLVASICTAYTDP